MDVQVDKIDRKKERQTDRQSDRQKERQTDGCTDGGMDIRIEKDTQGHDQIMGQDHKAVFEQKKSLPAETKSQSAWKETQYGCQADTNYTWS